MKIDRQIGILSILLQREKVTAPFLAERFEVSKRTINRDVEDLCKAGIPLVTTQGQGGGITIMDGYRMDRTVLTSSDMQAILTGLRSLDSVSGTTRYQRLMDKLSMGSSSVVAPNQHILINLSSWYKSTLAPKMELIQKAIEQKKQVSFHYYSPVGESERVVEPCMLVFQWSSWYLWGYCTEREDYRLFKLNRMTELLETEDLFDARVWVPYQIEEEPVFLNNIDVSAAFTPSAKWRLIEEYGVDSFVEEGGKLLFCTSFAGKTDLFYWLLGFGDQVELLEPEELRAEFGQLAEKIGGIYQER